MKAAPQPPPLSHAHHAPPAHIRALHKAHQKSPLTAPTVLDFDNLPPISSPSFPVITPSTISAPVASAAFSAFSDEHEGVTSVESDIPIYKVASVPGLQVIPNLLPPSVQKTLLRKLLFRDLSDPRHKTNLHAHYHLPPPPPDVGSYFESPPETTFRALSADGRDLPVDRMLDKKLRWVTLGGQYDWTLKKYPVDSSSLPEFPEDICDLVSSLFGITSQAAIVNIYSPGDTLAPHRDVSEASCAPLVSVSLGCEALFIAGVGDQEGVVVRVRSGDAVVMSGEARWAWHSVPTIAGGTCPEWLQEWPEERRGWMRGKRVNLNVRQMWD
ncbi:hypothetical protein L873DRAFT_1810771 [Choiromyces venosus 120613-1]|uniref:Fe2OG dioxygenase domain-containing protein n=1 Tax=Choiromyces venosus 120613-1 TaxID=1336337 RepID=A0A3N4JER2_9PEZI|nr:hypothetical protein L873DRAFT_1810771 [Choiromyces venosus 120613-1]